MRSTDNGWTTLMGRASPQFKEPILRIRLESALHAPCLRPGLPTPSSLPCVAGAAASLRIYARLNREVYGQWLDFANGQRLSSVQGANLPQLPGPCQLQTLQLWMLSSQAYHLRNAVRIVRDGECASLDRTRLQLLASRIPEIDVHGFFKDMAELDIESVDPDEFDNNVYHAL